MSQAVSTKRIKPSYTFQRVHAALQTGHALTVQQKREEPMPCFMQQSMLDASCGLHVAAMLVAILDMAKVSALHDMGRRKYGVAAEIFGRSSHRISPEFIARNGSRRWRRWICHSS